MFMIPDFYLLIIFPWSTSGCQPYIGPHDTIGKDEITFLASYTGEVKLVDFKHLKSYELPENLKDLEKKKQEVANEDYLYFE